MPCLAESNLSGSAYLPDNHSEPPVLSFLKYLISALFPETWLLLGSGDDPSAKLKPTTVRSEACES